MPTTLWLGSKLSLATLRLPAIRKKRGQVFEYHDDRRKGNTKAHKRAQLAKARQPAKIQHQERADCGHRRPENTGRNFAANLWNRQVRMGKRLLIVYDRVIHGQSEQDGGEA